MNQKEILKSLRQVEQEYKNAFTSTGEVRISAMAKDAADTIEELLGRLSCHYQLYKLAYYDTLTGCYNRNMLEKMRTELDSQDFIIGVIDLDDLKHYNTIYGHIGGDKRIQEISSKLIGAFEQVYRLGGDEFMIITNRHPEHIAKILDDIGEISYGLYKKDWYEFLDSAMHKADLFMLENKEHKKRRV